MEGPAPSAQPTIDESEARGVSPLWYVFAVVVALVGGLLGMLGAIIQEIRAGGFILLPVFGAPVIEETLKPAGVYILLARWPRVLRSQLFTAVLAALAGLTFGLVESAAYVSLYADEAPEWYTTYRFTAPVALHIGASFIVGLAINRRLADWVQGRGPLPKRTRNLYFTAMAMHAIFNTTALALEIGGVFDAG